jgi:alkylhydroperoxidase family enzyme
MDIRHAVGVKAGIPEAKLDALEGYAESPWFSARERAALAFCEEVVRDDRDVSDGTEARLREHFSAAERVELTFVAGYQVFASKFAKAYRLAPQGFSRRAAAVS